MTTKFDNGSINFSNTPNPSPTTSSSDVKLYQENGTFKTIGFDGVSKPLVPQQEIKVAQVAVNTTEDANEFVLRIPSPNAKLQALEVALRNLIASKETELIDRVSEVAGALESFKESQLLANGVLDSNISDIENKLSETIDLVNTKVTDEDFSRLKTDFSKVIQNISNSIEKLVSKTELDKRIKGFDYLTPNSTIDGGVIK